MNHGRCAVKKILIRTGMSPLDDFPPEYYISHGVLGNNIGNSLYAYSLFRTLTTDDNSLEPTYLKYRYTDEEIEQINSEYSAFIVPLANAFRKDFIKELNGLTSMIKRLKIPCIVTGVGTDIRYGDDIHAELPFEKEVKEFISAALDKSAVIGVRGQFTADYLKRLGFSDDKDIMVIGCPSMYMHGRELSIKDFDIRPDSKIAINYADMVPDNILRFTLANLSRLEDPYTVGQTAAEMQLVYCGKEPAHNSGLNMAVSSVKDRMYVEDRMRFPLYVQAWLDFMKEMDFTFGSRLHGNIASILAGVPAFMVCKDFRMQELSEYHGLPWIAGDAVDENTDIFKLIENVDLHSPEKVQADNFDRFISFLDMNGLDHIYKDGNEPQRVPLDEQMSVRVHEPILHTLAGCSTEEVLDRLQKAFAEYDKVNENKINGLKEKNRTLRSENKELSKKCTRLEKNLDRKIVKYALKVGNAASKVKGSR